jgi:hypothetical protein
VLAHTRAPAAAGAVPARIGDGTLQQAAAGVGAAPAELADLYS